LVFESDCPSINDIQNVHTTFKKKSFYNLILNLQWRGSRETQPLKVDMLTRGKCKSDFSFSHVIVESMMTDHELASITVLNLFCLNGILQDMLEQVAGRQKQIERVVQIHCKRRKNKPCLLGVILESEKLSSLRAWQLQPSLKGTIPSKLEGNEVILRLSL